MAEQQEHSHAYMHEHGIPHEHSHGHTHSHTQTRAVVNRLARAIGHLERVKAMVEEGRDCSEVLIQLAAVRSAINNTGKVILKDPPGGRASRAAPPAVCRRRGGILCKIVRRSAGFSAFFPKPAFCAWDTGAAPGFFGHSAEFSGQPGKTPKMTPMGGFYTCFFRGILLR